MDAGISDMKEIEYHHCPSLAYREDLASPIAVGWLGSKVPTSGEVPGALRDALRHACNTRGTDFGELGSHVCQVCEAHEDRAEFIIAVEDRVYVLPRMVLHYVDEHGYRPPDVFLEDLRRWWATV